MRLGIGIDTGGTYTDAVLYDYDSATVLNTAKAQTTHHDLAVGITQVIEQLPCERFSEVGIAALSTTLATNACVEDKGGRARLLLLGVDPAGTAAHGSESGLPPAEEIRFLDCSTSIDGRILREPNWADLQQNAHEWFAGDEAICIVEQHAMRNGGVLEYKARDLLAAALPSLPIVCGNDLFSDLYVFQRAASALLNGGLLTTISAFLRAIDAVFQAHGLAMPRVTVRSDGTLMSEEMTAYRPVDTLLSGPAASICGGLALAQADHCILADMGGTTTDVAFAADGAPLRAVDGIRVGRWRTFAKGLDIDTFALGGDTGVRVVQESPVLLSRRLTPLCVLCKEHPAIKADLEALAARVPRHTLPLHECFSLTRDVSDNDPHYDASEHALILALRARPLIYEAAAVAAGVDKYMLHTERLEREGIIQRAGITPTDIMHIKGDFNRFDATAPISALNFLARCAFTTPERLADKIYDMVKQRLYSNLVRILLEHRQPSLRASKLPDALETMIAQSWRTYSRQEKPRFWQPQFTCNAALVGLGAPMRLFLPDVAKALGAPCILPPFAEVANAVGAVCGNIRAEISIEVRQGYQDAEGAAFYYLLGETDSTHYSDMDEAIAVAKSIAMAHAKEEAIARGATGHISVTCRSSAEEMDILGCAVCLSSYVTAVAVGAAGFQALS